MCEPFSFLEMQPSLSLEDIQGETFCIWIIIHISKMKSHGFSGNEIKCIYCQRLINIYSKHLDRGLVWVKLQTSSLDFSCKLKNTALLSLFSYSHYRKQ